MIVIPTSYIYTLTLEAAACMAAAATLALLCQWSKGVRTYVVSSSEGRHG